MASGKGAGTEIKQHFVTKEGCYRVMDLSEYCRPNKIPYAVQQCHPVRVSFITVKEQSGCNDRIAFNVGRELYFYIYKGVRKVGNLRTTRFVMLFTISQASIWYINCSFAWRNIRHLSPILAFTSWWKTNPRNALKYFRLSLLAITFWAIMRRYSYKLFAIKARSHWIETCLDQDIRW